MTPLHVKSKIAISSLILGILASVSSVTALSLTSFAWNDITGGVFNTACGMSFSVSGVIGLGAISTSSVELVRTKGLQNKNRTFAKWGLGMGIAPFGLPVVAILLYIAVAIAAVVGLVILTLALIAGGCTCACCCCRK